ncbi:MAG: hypothetical protein UT57_C0051G0015, partial [Microgenomates group bacterium GW2011_GWC1_39_7]
RSYKPQDFEKVRENIEEAGLYYPEMDNENRLAEKISRNPDSILVAIFNDEIAGSIFIMENGRESFLFRLAVRKKHRGKGIGTELLKRAEKLLQEKGYSEVSLLIREEKLNLKNYYTKRGYKQGNLYRWFTKKLS